MRAGFREITRGIGFTEGPLRLGDGGLLVTSMSRGVVYLLDLSAADGDDPVRGQIETGGGPNGLAMTPDGTVWVAQNGGATGPSRSTRPVVPGIQRLVLASPADPISRRPAVTVALDGEAHAPPSAGSVSGDGAIPGSVAPNDLTVGPDGALWFTDPGRDAARGLGPRVRRWVPGEDQSSTVIDDLHFPNGLAFSPDGSELLVADSQTSRIVRYAREGQSVHRIDVFAEIEGSEPDGIAFDRDGRLYVAAFGSNDVVVLDPEGLVERRLPTGERSRPTNLCFAGAAFDTLVVTLASGGRVVLLEETVRGLPV